MTKKYIEIAIPKEQAAVLRGRQSVRTTFKLPERSITALSLLAAQLGIKQKSLFDHLVEDMDALRTCARVAEKHEATGRKEPGIAKTYVISRKTLENLEHVAAGCSASRDALVISSIERIMPLLAQEQQKHQQRKQVLAETANWLEAGGALFQRSRKHLGDDDPAVAELYTMLEGAQKAFANLASMVEKGKKIETF